MIQSLLVSHRRRMDLGNEYFEGNLGDILTTVTQCAIDAGVQECARVWRQRSRTPRCVVVVRHGQTCESVMEAFMVSIGGMMTGQYTGCRLKLGTVHDHVRAFAERKGLFCKTLTAGNVGAKFASLYGCKMLQISGEKYVMFPGEHVEYVVVGGDPMVEPGITGPRTYLAEQDSVKMFLAENCEFGEGLRVSSTDLFDRYKATTSEEATNKWFHAQMKVKGFVKKTVRLSGGGQVQGYEGFSLSAVALDDALFPALIPRKKKTC